MNAEHGLPATLLGLPSPSARVIRDDEMHTVYESFVGQLELVADAKVILSNPYELEIEASKLGEMTKDWRSELPRREWKKLLLLSLISRPMDASGLWPDDRRKFTDSELVNLFWPTPNRLSLSDAKGEIPFGVGTVEGLLEAVADPGLSQLFAQIPLRKEIISMSAEFVGGQPGNYDYQMWQIAQWSENWAVVFGITDAAKESYLFPWVLGFIQTDDAQRNFVHLLYEGTERFDPGFYFSYGTVYSDWFLAELALAGGDDGVDWEMLLLVLSLEDSVIESLLRDEEIYEPNPLTARLRDLDDMVDMAELGQMSIYELVQMVGTGSSLSDIEKYLEKVADDL